MRVSRALASLSVMAATLCGGCHSGSYTAAESQIRVVTTTGILADFVENVGGDHVHVSQIIPDSADPHSFEPSLRAVRDIAYADIAFTNYLLLEQHSIIRILDANLPQKARSVSIAEEASKNGANILPLVEDRSLDTPWLGMRVSGRGQDIGLSRSSTVDLSAVKVDGPGTGAAYLTTTFGDPEIAFSSDDGFDEGSGFSDDTMTLPADAHTHLSWAFSEPGIYRVTFKAGARAHDTAAPIHIPQSTAVFAVGVDPHEVARTEQRHIFSAGHADITVNLDERVIELQSDHALESHQHDGRGDAGDNQHPSSFHYALDDVVIEVPSRTLAPVPSQGYRFLGHPGEDVYILPQAVLGKHVHGDIDPHLWHDMHNAAAYVRVIRDTLVEADPTHADYYRRNAAEYLARLDAADAEVTRLINDIPVENRHVVTTHDAYGYLAAAYDLNIAGFVAPHPGSEPSIRDRQRLAATLHDLKIPAVFLEPQLARGRSPVATIAKESGVKVCPLYGDTLDREAPTYIDMMLFNARSLNECLKPKKEPQQ